MIHVFILNPTAGSRDFSESLRSKLEEIPDIQYFIFSSGYRGEERELVRRALDIFEGEQLRFYICGGTGTLHEAVNGFGDALGKYPIAFYPCGFSNDFLNNFGADAARFKDISELVFGDVIDVDYIKTNHGIAINAFSMGVDTYIIRTFTAMRPLTAISNTATIVIAAVRSLFKSRPMDLEVKFDDYRLSEKVSEIFFGNGISLGGKIFFETKPQITDGLANVCILPPRSPFQLTSYFTYTMKKDMDSLREVSDRMFKSRHMTVSTKDGSPLSVNMDGSIYTIFPEYEVEIVPKGLHLIVPKGVRA